MPGPVPKIKGPGFSLPFKLALCLVLSTVAFWALFGYLNLRVQRSQSEQTILLSAERISDVIWHATRHEMLRNDREALRQVITDIGTQPGIRLVRLFNKEGRISFSSNQPEVGTLVDKRAEQCYACHARSEPLAKLNRPDRARIFDGSVGGRVLAMIRPVENHPDCSNAACHAHPPDKRILGVIDAQVSLANVDAQQVEHQEQLAAFTVLAAVLISLVTVVLVWRMVQRPIHELIVGTKRVSAGDLNHTLAVRTRDELGVLAASFNKMTSDLAAAREEITSWAKTLEDRVHHKTQELERAYTSLVASEKMASLGKLAATVAHEVNNPLFGMLTYARLTSKALSASNIDQTIKEEAVENLRIIERESRRCGDIIKNLLTYSRQAPPRPQSSELNALVERTVDLVRHKLELQNVGIEVSLAAGLPQLWCDAGQIQQVILVLLVNAAEAMLHGGELRVATDAAPGGEGVRLRVQDKGIGIPPEVLSHIFEPFFTTKEDQQRTGLGLAVARSIVEQHAGEITVTSKPGQGTEFTVILPQQPQADGSGTASSIQQDKEIR